MSVSTSPSPNQSPRDFGDKRFAIYHYTLEVNEISGDPVSIDVPTDVVDAPADGG